MMLAIWLVGLLVLLLTYIWYKAHQGAKHWDRSGLRSLKPLPFVGNGLPLLLGTKNYAELFQDLHRAFPDQPLVGYTEMGKPVLIVKDPDYIEKVLIKDFVHFTDHGFSSPDEAKQPVDHYQLFSLNGAKWRAFRYKMTPLFTSGKLRFMYGAYDNVGAKLLKVLKSTEKTGVHLREILHLFVLDFVGQAIFGLNANCLENPGCEYHIRGTNIFQMGYFKLAFMNVFPNLARRLGMSFNNPETVKYFFGVIEEAFNYRKKNNISRNDFIQMMMQLKEKGKIEVQKWDPNDDYLKENNNAPIESFELSDVALMTQAYTFLTTGLDGVTIAMQFAFFEVAKNPRVQEKVRQEILEQTKIHSGLTYEALKSMTYLENVVHESMRMYPLSLNLTRVCNKDYTFPNGYTIKERETLMIPVLALHMDENYHSEPEVFKPERFESSIRPLTFFPFSDGPRVCIAMRFALLQMKFALAIILSNYRLKLNPKSSDKLQMKPRSIMYEPKKDVLFDLEPL